MATKIKRVVAFAVDWFILTGPAFLLVFFVMNNSLYDTSVRTFEVLLQMFASTLLWMLALALFVLRDVIFKGRSIGKRIFGLYILDKDTLAPVGSGRRVLLGLFSLAYIFDVFFLFITGRTIGERISRTVVMSKDSA